MNSQCRERSFFSASGVRSPVPPPSDGGGLPAARMEARASASASSPEVELDESLLSMAVAVADMLNV